jgi:hypothetical protein
MLRRFSVAVILSLSWTCWPCAAEELDDADFEVLMARRKLPTPATIAEFADQVGRMRRLWGKKYEIA